jgi:peptide/nickel transport system permease protein
MQQVVSSDSFHRYTTLLTIDSLLNGRFDIFLDALRHMILPILTLSYLSWATFLRVTRSSMLETLRQEYVTTARAKGLAERDVIFKHARPNAMISVVTLAGFTIVGLMGGVVITETVFDYPGIGKAAAEAAGQLDVVTVLGFALFNGLILIVANLVVDVLYAAIDPRVRLS